MPSKIRNRSRGRRRPVSAAVATRFSMERVPRSQTPKSSSSSSSSSSSEFRILILILILILIEFRPTPCHPPPSPISRGLNRIQLRILPSLGQELVVRA